MRWWIFGLVSMPQESRPGCYSIRLLGRQLRSVIFLSLLSQSAINITTTFKSTSLIHLLLTPINIVSTLHVFSCFFLSLFIFLLDFLGCYAICFYSSTCMMSLFVLDDGDDDDHHYDASNTNQLPHSERSV